MPAIVKIQWTEKKDGWSADLFLVDEEGFFRKPLRPGRKMEFELTDERRCTGFSEEIGIREPCPEYREIDKGSQCFGCQRRGIYSDYVRGNRGMDTDRDFSVYLAQCGETVKVGVTRTEKVVRRWVEQGADFGAEIFSGLSSDMALEKESEISSDRNITERVRKEQKVVPARENLLRDTLEREGFDAEVVDLREKTVYPPNNRTELRRKGLFSGRVRTVKGQLISNGRVSMAMTSGKVMKKPVQQGLGSFQ